MGVEFDRGFRAPSRRMASYTSWRCTGTSPGAMIPSRTASCEMRTTVTTMSSPIMMRSSGFRDRTSITGFLPDRSGRALKVGDDLHDAFEVVAEGPEGGITLVTEESADLAGGVIVVDMEAD